MNVFHYERAVDAATAVRLAGRSGSAFLGGGTNLVDLMREGVEHPERLVDVSGLDATIEARDDGGLRIGAAATNTAVAEHRAVRERYPLLARAILSGASAQIRNAATVGGNLLQRTRCLYFIDAAARCNKREPGSGCDALEGCNRMHAILGVSPECVATHPSDLAVALVALDAVVRLRGAQGERTVAVEDLHRLPDGAPERETVLRPGELVTAVEIPPLAAARDGVYRKARDRASYAFALVSVAAVLDTDGDGRVETVRLALGGVAPKPWRARRAEAVLHGRRLDERQLRRAAAAELEPALPLAGNAFKVELAARMIAAALRELSGVTP